MGTSKVTRPDGVHPDALPPEFDGWDAGPNVPDHPMGKPVAIDYDTGLPIIKRGNNTTKPAESQPTTAKPAEKPDAPAEKPEKPAAPDKKQDDTPAKPAALTKGQKVKHADGTTGTVAYVDKQLKIARVTKDGGGSMTAPLSKLSSHDDEAKETDVPAGHTFVKAHLRPLPEKTK